MEGEEDRVGQKGGEVLSVGVQRAAELVGVGRTKIFAAIASGQLSSFRVGKRRLILTASLKDWVSRLAHDGSTEPPA